MTITTHQKQFIVAFSLGFATAILAVSAVLYLRSPATVRTSINAVKTNDPVVIVSENGDGVTMGTPDAVSEIPTTTQAEGKAKLPLSEKVSIAKNAPQTDEKGFQISRLGFSFRKSDWKTYKREKKPNSLDDYWIDETVIEPLRKNKLMKFQIQAYHESGKPFSKSKSVKKKYKLAVKRLPATVAHALSMLGPKETILVKLNTLERESRFKWPMAQRRDLIYEIKRN